MSKKSLDILEEQLFGLLEDYTPQTGRGFSDGNEYVGKKTKGPYEYVAEEDTPWYKKKYKEDSKNLKILIGHGSKTPKYAKKGGPFTQDPPKRRPVNKLSAPPMVLDEAALPQGLEEAFLKIQEAEISFIVKNDFKDLGFLVFKKGTTYKANIKGNILISQTEDLPFFGTSKSLTKQEFLKKLKEKGEICNVVECDKSTITIAGQQTITFTEFIQQATNQQKPEQPAQVSEPQFTAAEKQKMAQNTRLFGGMISSVAAGGDVKDSIKQELGYHPITQKFADEFYGVMEKALQKIPNPDERKTAALMAVLIGEITAIPINLTATLYGEIPPEFIESAGKILSSIYAPIAEKIEELQQMWNKVNEKLDLGKKVDAAKEKAEELISDVTKASTLSGLPNAKGQKNGIVVIGDLQKDSLINVFKEVLNPKGYQVIQTFDYPSNSNFSEITKENNIMSYLDSNKDKIGLLFISLGNNSASAVTTFSESRELIKTLKEKVPNTEIIWVGSPPVQKSDPLSNKKNDIIKDNNTVLTITSKAQRYIFINPFDYLSDNEVSGMYKNDTTLSDNGAKKILTGALSGGDKPPITADSNDLTNINNFIVPARNDVDLNGVQEKLKMELIKLSKRAKEAFGNNAKVIVFSGVRADSANHAPGLAADILINNGSSNLNSQQTYAFIISAILDGVILDGTVGYYATKDYYNEDSLSPSDTPHYDLRLTERKYMWIKCKNNDPTNDPCKNIRGEKYFNKRTDPKAGPEDYHMYALNMTAKQLTDSSNPLKLPKDVFSLLNTYKRSAAAESKKSVLEAFKDEFVNGLSQGQKDNINIIQKQFSNAGYSNNVIAAAIINSYKECGISSYAVGPGGAAVGVFQVYARSNNLIEQETRKEYIKLCNKFGLAAGDDRTYIKLKDKQEFKDFVKQRIDAGDNRFDPEDNANIILSFSSRLKRVEKGDKENKSIPELTYLYSYYVEIPGLGDTRENKSRSRETYAKNVTKIERF